jgi:hypothetical protein
LGKNKKLIKLKKIQDLKDFQVEKQEKDYTLLILVCYYEVIKIKEGDF